MSSRRPTVLYWDSSAVLSALMQEVHSRETLRQLRAPCHHLVSSLALAETHAVLSRNVQGRSSRRGRTTSGTGKSCRRDRGEGLRRPGRGACSRARRPSPPQGCRPLAPRACGQSSVATCQSCGCLNLGRTSCARPQTAEGSDRAPFTLASPDHCARPPIVSVVRGV